MTKKRKKKNNPLDSYTDFATVMKLSERLSGYLRQLFKLDKASWNFALDKIRQGNSYREWRKFKGKGKGYRYFAAPCPELKVVQKAIKANFLDQVVIHFTRNGCQSGAGIVENAAVHAGARSVFSVDIVNAYPSILRSRIRSALQKPFRFLLDQFGKVDWQEEDIRQMLEAVVDLLCLHDRLPQGPCTSPRLMGIVCYKMDRAIFDYLREQGTVVHSFKMTSWFDDTSISSNQEIPEDMRDRVLQIIKDYKFVPHTREDKTKYYSPETGEVPIITGIVLCPDGRLKMAPKKINQLRAAMHNWLKLPNWDEQVLGKVNGTLGAIRQIHSEKVPSQIRALVSGIEDRLHAEKVAGSVRVLENKMLPDDLQVLARTIMSAVNSGQMQKTGKLVSENMLFVDGACRKDYSASIGGVLLQPNKEVVMISRLVGKATSNQAEYQALIAGLEQVKEFGITDIDCFTDSQLMAKQLVGTFKVQSAQLRPLFVRAKQLMDDIGNVRIHHVKREENVGAHNLAQMAFNDLV